MEEIAALMVRTFDTVDEAKSWLVTPNRLLASRTPIEVIMSGRTSRVLGALKAHYLLQRTSRKSRPTIVTLNENP